MKNILKGFIIGIAKIMPGVSGSMLSISLGVYEKLLGIIADLKNITWSKFKFLFTILFGALISICLFSKGVKWVLESFYFPIILLFIGLIIGGLPDFINEVKGNFKLKNIIIFILAFIFSYTITLFGTLDTVSNENIFIYFVLGLIEAFSSIVPGISGTAIYMSLGVYDLLLDFFGNIFNPLYFKFALFFGLGVLVGIFILAKTITFLLKNKKEGTYYGILGFMFSSVILMFKEAFINIISKPFDGFVLFEFFIGIIFLILGYKITIKINNLLSSN